MRMLNCKTHEMQMCSGRYIGRNKKAGTWPYALECGAFQLHVMNQHQRMGMTALILLLFVAPDLILSWPRHRLQSLHKLVSGDFLPTYWIIYGSWEAWLVWVPNFLIAGDRDRAIPSITITGSPGISNFPNIPGFPDAPCSSLQCTISSFLNHISFFCLSDTTCHIIHGPNNKCFNK